MHEHLSPYKTLGGKCLKFFHVVKNLGDCIQKICYSLQQQKVKSVKRTTTITELVVVWSLCSVCTSVTKSKVVNLKHSTLFAIAIARSRKISVYGLL